MNVLITGMSGTGKSTLVAELRRRGYAAYDADDDGFSEPREHGRWGWRAERVRELLHRSSGPLFFAGCSEEQVDLPFDRRVALTAPASVIAERVRARSTNAYGRAPGELEQILDDLSVIEPLLCASADLVLDATQPTAALADRVLAATVARVRGAVGDDAAAVLELRRKAIRVSAAGLYEAGAIEVWAAGGSEAELRRRIETTTGFVAVLEERIVGWANLDGDEVGQLYVHPDFGGAGVARRLLACVEAVARERGEPRLTTTASLRSIGVFARAGFTELRRERRVYDGLPYEVADMAKSIE